MTPLVKIARLCPLSDILSGTKTGTASLISWFLFTDKVGDSVKAIDILSVAIPSSPSKPRTWTRIVASVSSDGFIRIFDLGALPAPHSTPIELSGEKGGIPALEAVAEYDTKGSRLTCCTLADGETPAKVGTGKRKRVEVSSDDDASDGEEQGDDAEEVLNSDDEDGADTQN